MQVELVYQDGKFVPITPLHIKNKDRRFVINVPDDEVEKDPAPDEPVEVRNESFQDQLNAIRQPIQSNLDNSASKPLSKNERRELLSEEWEERHRDNE